MYSIYCSTRFLSTANRIFSWNSFCIKSKIWNSTKIHIMFYYYIMVMIITHIVWFLMVHRSKTWIWMTPDARCLNSNAIFSELLFFLLCTMWHNIKTKFSWDGTVFMMYLSRDRRVFMRYLCQDGSFYVVSWLWQNNFFTAFCRQCLGTVVKSTNCNAWYLSKFVFFVKKP